MSEKGSREEFTNDQSTIEAEIVYDESLRKKNFSNELKKHLTC